MNTRKFPAPWRVEETTGGPYVIRGLASDSFDALSLSSWNTQRHPHMP